MAAGKRGRPPLPEKELKSRFVGIRFTHDDYQKLERAAKKAGAASVTEWIRDSANARARAQLRRA